MTRHKAYSRARRNTPERIWKTLRTQRRRRRRREIKKESWWLDRLWSVVKAYNW